VGFLFAQQNPARPPDKQGFEEAPSYGKPSVTKKIKKKSFAGWLGRSNCIAFRNAREVGRTEACGMVMHNKNQLEDLQWQLPLYLEHTQFHFRADS